MIVKAKYKKDNCWVLNLGQNGVSFNVLFTDGTVSEVIKSTIIIDMVDFHIQIKGQKNV